MPVHAFFLQTASRLMCRSGAWCGTSPALVPLRCRPSVRSSCAETLVTLPLSQRRAAAYRRRSSAAATRGSRSPSRRRSSPLPQSRRRFATLSSCPLAATSSRQSRPSSTAASTQPPRRPLRQRSRNGLGPSYVPITSTKTSTPNLGLEQKPACQRVSRSLCYCSRRSGPVPSQCGRHLRDLA